jgi:RNA polymerase subunit RPABC4/transcription elongation factor Spt4
MKCNNCETENLPNALKCINCNVLLDGSMIAPKEKNVILEEGEVLCKNCNTTNSLESLKCSHCNTALDGSMVIKNKVYKPSTNPVSTTTNNSNNEAIAVETKMKPNNESQGNSCSKCGYLNREESSICIQCGSTLDLNKWMHHNNLQTTIKNEEVPIAVPLEEIKPEVETISNPPLVDLSIENNEIGTATINPWAAKKRSGFKLTPLQLNDNTHVSELFFGGDTVTLNRGNLEIDNSAISSQKHAIISQESGKWYITDCSSQQTTFIRVGDKTLLQNDDVILIGNRLYCFKPE